ncbi:MAG: CheR family methyltransferase [Bacteroidota bacterium]
MGTPELGITDTRNIVNAVKELYGYDFSNYALTSFRRRLERLMYINNVSHPDGLILKLKNDSGFFDKFLYDLYVDSTEMFRDPSLWRLLRDKYLPAYLKKYGKIKIWIPVCVTGEELYTLAITVKELGITNNTEIHASFFSEMSVEEVKKGIFKSAKLEISEENYTRYQGDNYLSSYFTQKNDFLYRDDSLIKNVIFRKQNIIFDNSPDNIHMVLFRNQMIYYNQTLSDNVLKIIHGSMVPGGLLATGIMEKLPPGQEGRMFNLIEDNESIYQKR